MIRTAIIQSLACAVLALALSSTAAFARCPTLTGFAAFKRCYMAADSAMQRNNLRTMYETMLAEDLEAARPLRDRTGLQDLGDVAPLGRPTASEVQRNLHSQTPLPHRSIEMEMQQRQSLSQQRSFDAGRARNQFQLDQGRARSHDLLGGAGRW